MTDAEVDDVGVGVLIGWFCFLVGRMGMWKCFVAV